MSAPWVVAKVCQAEDLIQQAGSLLQEARHDIARIDGEGGPVAETALAELAGIAESLDGLRADLGRAVRHTASLIATGDGREAPIP